MSRIIRALITTIEPIDGGVPTMTKWICQVLEENNIVPILAWYAPWRNQPDLSVPCYKLVVRSPSFIEKTAFGKYEGVGVGCWLPELEFTHYLTNIKWKDLIQSCHLHISVSGNPLSASPYVIHRIPFIAWIATPWEADRQNRIKEFSVTRRIFDSLINKPFLGKLERNILRSSKGNIIALSEYTAREFHRLSGKRVNEVMLMPVNTKTFYPAYNRVIKKTVGFSGRFCDPRKNIGLLLKAMKIIVAKDPEFRLILVGDKDFAGLIGQVKDLGLAKNIDCRGHMNTEDLASLLQTLDVFVIPSHQEGLCIAALEAMACGIPIVSTRCGGPEDYVIPGETGILVESNPSDLANAVIRICDDRNTRNELSEGAHKWIKSNASPDVSRQIIRRNLRDLAVRNSTLIDFQKMLE